MPRSCCLTLRRYRATVITTIHSSRMYTAGFSGCLLGGGGKEGMVSAWDVYTGGCVSNGVSAQESVCPGDGCLPSRMSARGWCLPGVFLPRGCLQKELSAWECPPKGLSAWGCLPKGVSAWGMSTRGGV